MTDAKTTTEWLTPQSIMLAVAVFALLVQAAAALIGLIKFMWKVATKDDIELIRKDIKSLKDDTERDVESLKTDTERDMASLKTDIERDVESLKTDVREIRQDSTNQPAKNETRHAGVGPPSLEVINTREKGDFTADERENRTRS